MIPSLSTLRPHVERVLNGKLLATFEHVGELTIEVAASDWVEAAMLLRDDPACRFEQLIDLCGVDYSTHGEGRWQGQRYATVCHLLSVSLNQRLRIRTFAPEDDFPTLPSLVEVWPVANWFEREAFDLFGLMFEGHPDLRRILTDYGFIGHPFRKDFPMTGHVEMRYDPEQKRVIYQPVSVELRNNVPRVIRHEGFHHGGN